MSRKSFDVFLSHNSCDKATVERIARKLRQAGLEPWLDRWYLTPGGDWQDELAAGMRSSRACAVLIGPHGIGDWENLEYKTATDRMAKEARFRVFLVLLPGLHEQFDATTLPPFLSTRTWVDLRKGIEDLSSFQILINAIKGIASGPDDLIELDKVICPYVGLQTFEEKHADFFFGRQADTQRLKEKLKSTRFLLVTGPSGSGKSSLVRAGLVSSLKKGALPGSDSWIFQIFKPGAHPITALAASILRLFPHDSMQKTIDQMATDQRTLHLAVSLALTEPITTQRLVLVVDQFEEIFTLCRNESERTQFIANLIYAALIPDGPTTIILTLRADFYHKCASYPELSVLMAAQQFLVSPMDTESLRQVIEQPAWRVGLEFELGLVETILDEVKREPGALPLLEQALLELWERRRGRLITLNAYRESGGVKGAIAKRADGVYESLDAPQREYVRSILLRLIQPGEGTEDTRRRALMSELITQTSDVTSIETVIYTLADARILTITNDLQIGDTLVDISHEALIRAWPKLRHWIDEKREDLRLHRRIAEAAREWSDNNKDTIFLYRDGWLSLAIEWRERNDSMLNTIEREFLDESIDQHESEMRYLIDERAQVLSRTRKLGLVSGGIESLLGRIPSSTEEMERDWQNANLALISDIFEGRIRFTRIRSVWFRRLEEQWLDEFKIYKAHSIWESEKGSMDPELNYYRACEYIRKLLVQRETKAFPGAFKEVRAYIESNYLTGGKIDKGKAGTKKLLDQKIIHYTEKFVDDCPLASKNSEMFSEMFYQNIISAIVDNDYEKTLLVLKAFQHSQWPETYYPPINCFEACLAIYFLDPNIIQELWEKAKMNAGLVSWPVNTIVAQSWPEHLIVEKGLGDFFSYDKASNEVHFRGVMTKEQKERLMNCLSNEEQVSALERLYEQSRLVPRERIL
jgi:energy-coupling factor transporter ATP-binding protein EcfA2